LGKQSGKIVLERLPNAVPIHGVVPVYEPMAHFDDAGPGNIGMGVLEFAIHATGRLPQDNDLAEDRPLYYLVITELRLTHP
jgi:hypothetical protein